MRSHFSFRPRLLPTLLTLLLLPTFIFLGRWQLHRFHEKKAIEQLYFFRQHHGALTLSQLLTQVDKRYYVVTMQGYFANQFQILLDNKIKNDHAGYEVLTVFFPDNETQGILINRGWIPVGKTREQLPTIAPLTSHEVLQGTIVLPPAKIFTLGKILENEGAWPLRAEALDISAIEKVVKHPLYPFVLQLTPSQFACFDCYWLPLHTDPYRSLSYAYQWFSFALVLIILYIGLNCTRRRVSS
jgi:surfeit locus 1 family protein